VYNQNDVLFTNIIVTKQIDFGVVYAPSAFLLAHFSLSRVPLMSEKEISDEIASRMGEKVASDSKLLAECALCFYMLKLMSLTSSAGVNICRIYNLTPETLQFKWEASTFSATPARAHETRFTFDSLQMVRQQINRERNATKTKRTNPRNAAPVLSAAKRKLPAFMTRGQASGASARMEEVSVKAEYLDSGIGASYDIAGSSAGMVSYEGPGRDERRDRACKLYLIHLQAYFIFS